MAVCAADAGAASGDAAADATVVAGDAAATDALVTRGDARGADVYFASGSAQLPVEAGSALDGVIKSMQADSAAKAVVSGFHDASGNAEVNAELSKQRAQNVRDVMAAAGIDPARIDLEKPVVTTGTGDAASARRVEIRLR